jgi:DNA-binding transcriptional regulator YiaG
MPDTRSEPDRERSWTPERIESLRKGRDQSQTDFGLDLMDTTPGYAQRRVSDLERGEREPTAAERRTLDRMAKGEV